MKRSCFTCAYLIRHAGSKDKYGVAQEPDDYDCEGTPTEADLDVFFSDGIEWDENDEGCSSYKEMMQMTPECDRCHHQLPILPTDETPAMLGFRTKQGKIVNICRNCLTELGRIVEQGEADKFLEDLGIGGEQ